jgi:hypothetical protein
VRYHGQSVDHSWQIRLSDALVSHLALSSGRRSGPAKCHGEPACSGKAGPALLDAGADFADAIIVYEGRLAWGQRCSSLSTKNGEADRGTESVRFLSKRTRFSEILKRLQRRKKP